jgi:CheY-like chemotaxis protein
MDLVATHRYQTSPMTFSGFSVKTVLLVCQDNCEDIQKQLLQSGCSVARVDNGASAIARARHEQLDCVLLASSGRDMDLAETALNLRDIMPSLQIFVLVRQTSAADEVRQADAILHAIPNAKIVNGDDLERDVIALKN